MKQFTFIDLFCGIGGFRQAMEFIGGTCVFSSDKNKNARLTYEANYHEVPAGDITKIEADEIPPFNVLCAGFPCQPFSLAGKQRGFEDARGTLFFDIARIVDYHKPEVIFLENVANLAKHDNGNTLRVIIETLEGLGYKVNYKILLASDFGVAQIRKRIYFVCFRNDLDVHFDFPEPFESDIAIEDFLDSDIAEKYYINDPEITLYKTDITNRVHDTCRIGFIRNLSQSRRIYSIKGLTPTFVVASRGPCGSTEAYCINGRVRRLTPNECRKILGFPEGFIFPVEDARAYEQIGNSVAIPVLKAIAKQIVLTGVFEVENA